MSDAAVREATASEVLTLEEEYEMQGNAPLLIWLLQLIPTSADTTVLFPLYFPLADRKANHSLGIESWQIDEDKLTFIIYRRNLELEFSSPLFLPSHSTSSMMGDVNLFLTNVSTPPSPSSSSASNPPLSPKRQAEIEIMLPNPSSSHQGFATECLQYFLAYASVSLDLRPDDFFVKIGKDNIRSIKLFERLGFKPVGDINYFGELEMRWFGEIGESGGVWGWEGRGILLVDNDNEVAP